MNNNQAGYFSQVATAILLLMAIICVAFYYHTNRSHAKAAIDYELSHTMLPSGCTEKSKSYNQGDGFDSFATWQVNYKCTKNIKSVFEDVKASSLNSGYKIDYEKDFSHNN